MKSYLQTCTEVNSKNPRKSDAEQHTGEVTGHQQSASDTQHRCTTRDPKQLLLHKEMRRNSNNSNHKTCTTNESPASNCHAASNKHPQNPREGRDQSILHSHRTPKAPRPTSSAQSRALCKPNGASNNWQNNFQLQKADEGPCHSRNLANSIR